MAYDGAAAASGVPDLAGPLPEEPAPEAATSRKPALFASTDRPRSLTESLLNSVAGVMGLPGLMGERDSRYDPHADQGLGFHQDGTARRANGSTGDHGGNFDGRRAASYLEHGLGYSSGFGSGYGSSVSGDPSSTLGYDPVTGKNYGHDSPRNARRSDSFGDAFMTDPQQYFLQRGLGYGMGWLNSLGEAGFTGLTGTGRARLNFQMDKDGRLNGEGDVLLPFYDGTWTTVFSEVGARSMNGFDGDGSGDARGAERWIGNFGLGQRWYPGASLTESGKVDSGDWMLGYNVFFDNDFSRGHQRGGAGVELQYDWLKLASNYYLPLSGWKGSRDFDSDYVEERPARGWDLRLKGYLPFYRNVALTGAYTQWYGDNVSMYSTSKLEKDPQVWSYGLEYTPIPLVSGYVNQRSTGRGNNDTEFGLRFTYSFDTSWEDQTSHAKVAESRTVAASRHDFVDRENRIILEYRAKENKYRILYIGNNRFHIVDGFNRPARGLTVSVTADGNYLAGPVSSASFVTDGNGDFTVTLAPGAPDPTWVTVKAGDASGRFPLRNGGGGGGGLTIAFQGAPYIVGGTTSSASTLVVMFQ